MANGWRSITESGDLLERQIKIDPATGDLLTRYRHWGDDLEEALRMNKTLYNADRASSSLWGDAHQVRVASIPLQVIQDWMRDDPSFNFYRWNEEDQVKLLRKLDDADWAALRTAPGRIS